MIIRKCTDDFYIADAEPKLCLMPLHTKYMMRIGYSVGHLFYLVQ